jgi:DNA-binding XRE family transcriptional regulator
MTTVTITNDRRRTTGELLAANIGRIRVECGITQGVLAERAGLARSTINRVEMGRTIPEWDIVCAIADALGCSLDDLRREI